MLIIQDEDYNHIKPPRVAIYARVSSAENKENLEISDSVDEGIRTFIVDNNYYINPQAFSSFIAPILKNKIKNNIISGDVDSIIKAIE